MLSEIRLFHNSICSFSETTTDIHPLLVLPPEILGIIIEEMDGYANETIIILSLVCKNLGFILESAGRYIRNLRVRRNKLLRLFSGIKSLHVDNIKVGLFNSILKIFNQKIFNNLRYLRVNDTRTES